MLPKSKNHYRKISSFRCADYKSKMIILPFIFQYFLLRVSEYLGWKGPLEVFQSLLPSMIRYHQNCLGICHFKENQNSFLPSVQCIFWGRSTTLLYNDYLNPESILLLLTLILQEIGYTPENEVLHFQVIFFYSNISTLTNKIHQPKSHS